MDQYLGFWNLIRITMILFTVDTDSPRAYDYAGSWSVSRDTRLTGTFHPAIQEARHLTPNKQSTITSSTV